MTNITYPYMPATALARRLYMIYAREDSVLLRLPKKPVCGKDAVYHESINGQVPFLTGHHDKGEVAAAGGFSSLDQAANLAVISSK